MCIRGLERLLELLALFKAQLAVLASHRHVGVLAGVLGDQAGLVDPEGAIHALGHRSDEHALDGVLEATLNLAIV